MKKLLAPILLAGAMLGCNIVSTLDTPTPTATQPLIIDPNTVTLTPGPSTLNGEFVTWDQLCVLMMRLDFATDPVDCDRLFSGIR